MDKQFKDYFSGASDEYKLFRPRYPTELYHYLAGTTPANQLAYDVGCGNGQAACALAEHFEVVHASDASATQIEQAQSRANVVYRVSPAETIACSDGTLDLVTVAQAIHWFQHDAFFKEVERALKPGGVLAAWGYQLLYTNTPLDDVVNDFHDNLIGPYWPAERKLLDDSYSRITFPYPRENAPRFQMTASWTFNHLVGYLNTWSAVKQYEQANGKNPIEMYFSELKSAWGDTGRSQQICWPLILYVGRKPSDRPF